MAKMNRRQFVRWVAGSAGALGLEQVLAACSQPAQPTSLPATPPSKGELASPTILVPNSPSTPTPNSQASPAQAGTPTTTSPTPTKTSPKSGATQLVVARGGEPEVLAQRAFAALGGMEAFVKKGMDVIIKPNICTAYHTYEYATTTNPFLVGALVKMALQAGAKRVRVMDAPFGGGPSEAYAISGIADEVKKAGGTMEIMSKLKYTRADIPEGKAITQWGFYRDILKADVVINVPIAKTHSLATLTLGMKNLMGVIQNRESIHANMGQMLADITSRVRPVVTVVDAIRILVRNGPTGGSLDDVKKLDTLIVSRDIVAADTYAAGLFNIDPQSLGYITAGAAMGLGTSDLASLKIEEINVGA